MDDLYRLRHLAGLSKQNLNEDAYANTFVKDQLVAFFNTLFEQTTTNLSNITEQLYTLETAQLNEENIEMLSDMKIIVNTLKKIKDKY